MLGALLLWLSRRQLSTVHRLGSALGALVFLVSGSYRRKLVGNLRAAGLDTPPVRRGAVRHAGMLATESARIWLRPPRRRRPRWSRWPTGRRSTRRCAAGAG